MPSFSCPLPVQCAGGWRAGNLAPAPHGCYTSESFSPRRDSTNRKPEYICTCVQQHRPPTMPFITTTITLFCLSYAAHQADTRWHGHVVSHDVVVADIGDQALDIVLHGPESAQKIGIAKTNMHSHIHSHPLMHTPKTKCKTVNSLNVTPSFSCPLPVQTGGGRRLGSLADAPQDCSTSEAFSPRTVLTENICRCVQHKLQHFPTTIPFLTTSTITLSCLTSAAPQADSWWLGHVELDDVVIADIGGQALDIFLHGPESARKNDIVKTFTHTAIPIHPCTLLKQTNSKTLNSPNMTPSFSSPLPVQCAGGRRVGNVAPAPHDCYTSESSPRTVLTENICTCVQQHRPPTIPFITTTTITLSCLSSAAHQADTRWLGHAVSEDVVIADIGHQALDIVHHGPESAHEIGIVKTIIHSHIHSHPPMHTPKTKSKTVNSLNVTPSFSCPPPVQSGGGRRPGSLADAPQDFSTSEAFSPRKYWQKIFVDVFNTNSSIYRQQCPF